jgi:phosphoribosylformylglycinamidine synthase I
VKVAIIQFPGTNCESETLDVCRRVMRWDAALAWHGDPLRSGLDLVVVPGGFSHGDHLRAGALAARSRIMEETAKFAEAGGLLIGICNGFQVLCEAGLLHGTLRLNRGTRFVCADAWLRVERANSAFTNACPPLVRYPIAHREGNYHADAETLRRLEAEGRVLFRYVDERGEATDAANPNGSANNIAGIVNERGNVCGLMPHPERAAEEIVGGVDGVSLFRSIEAWVENGALSPR